MKRSSFRRWSSLPAAALGLALLLSAGPSRHAMAQTVSLTGAQFDLTGNQVVNGADLDVAREEWGELLTGAPGAAGFDVNGDGASDVADVQLIAAQLGQGTTPQAVEALTARGPMLNADVTEKVFTVNSSASGNPNNGAFGDVNRGDGKCETGTAGVCTLQAALQETNAPRAMPYRAVIRFNIREADGSCPALVRIMPNLDFERWLQIDDSSGYGTMIDGYTQCDAKPNTNGFSGNAAIKIEIIGTKLGAMGGQFMARAGVNGIEVKSANNLIRGLSLYNWDRQIELSGPGTLYNRIQGNFIGTDVTNTFIAAQQSAHRAEGVRILNFASYNLIGCGSFENDGTFVPCTDEDEVHAARNIVAGNGNDGIHIEGLEVDLGGGEPRFNRIVGNYIGLAQDGRVRENAGGTSISKNQADGVDFEKGAQNNWLGGETDLERNYVAGNESEGIEISHDSRTRENRVVNNYFGINPYGEAAGNGDNGISVEDRANNTHIYKNVVGSNGASGIRAWVFGHENQIYDNYVGLLPDGSSRPNGRHGIYILGGSQRNIIRNNVVANNKDRGISISTESDTVNGRFGETYFNTITRNSVYNNRREGIKLDNFQNPQPIGNQALPRPLILGASTTLVVGTTCPNCRVEIFISDKVQLPDPTGENAGEGKTFVGEAVATGGGEFAVTVSGVTVGQLVTGTTTDTSGNTSEFARNFRVGPGIVSTLTPQPTATNTATATSTTAPTNTPTATTGPGTPTATTGPGTPTATRVPGQAGDVRTYLPLVRR